MLDLGFAEYGIALFAVAGVIFLSKSVIDGYTNKSKPKTESDNLRTVIENNTKAIQENTKSNQELQTVIRVTLAEHRGKLDEVLSRMRERS